VAVRPCQLAMPVECFALTIRLAPRQRRPAADWLTEASRNSCRNEAARVTSLLMIGLPACIKAAPPTNDVVAGHGTAARRFYSRGVWSGQGMEAWAEERMM
jgi:hypothetical protein